MNKKIQITLTHFDGTQTVKEYDENIINLDLSRNQIEKIDNLDKLINLQYLYLSNNKIEKIDNLDKLINLQTLYLSYNKIEKIENLDKLINLQYLYLSNNKIEKIDNLDKLIKLRILDLDNNKIENYNIIEEKFCFVDGIFNIIKSKKIKNNLIIIKTNKDTFIFNKDNYYSHGKTIKNAYSDLEFKIRQKDFNLNELVNQIKKSKIVNENDYRLLTGACKEGINLFKKEFNLNENYLNLNDLINLTKGKFGHNKIIEMFC